MVETQSVQHFQIDKLTSQTTTLSLDDEGSSSSMAEDDCNTQEVEAENTALLNGNGENSHHVDESDANGGACVFRTSLNIAKMCMGTGTLALPFAAAKGGLLFNAIGLFFIGFWNYYAANCLLRCLPYLPSSYNNNNKALLENKVVNDCSMADLEQKHHQSQYGALESLACCENGEEKKDSANDEYGVDTNCDYSSAHNTKEQFTVTYPPPPEGTTTFGAVAWYASGPQGLMVLDLLMLSLFFGLLIAYEVAMQSFINDIPFTTGSKRFDLLIPSTIIAILSCTNMEYLSTFSGIGLLAVGSSFLVISLLGIQENGFDGFTDISELNLWPDSLSAASSWFGVVVFGFGVSPFVFNLRDSMAEPQKINSSIQIGLAIVYVGYIAASNGILVLFSPSHQFEGDVLQAMPDTWVSLMVRLLMTFMIALTAPLIVVPCGELVEGKLGIGETQKSLKVLVRVLFCIICILISEFVPGFVHIVSFIGCFCVSVTGFVLPPLFCIQLSNRDKHIHYMFKGGLELDSATLCDLVVLVIGVVTTVVTSIMTFRELV